MYIHYNKNITPHKETKEMKEFCVVIKVESMPHNLILTYPNKNSGNIKEIEEEVTGHCCKFRGKGTNKELACDWLKDIREALNGVKPNDLILHHSDLFVDAYHRIH